MKQTHLDAAQRRADILAAALRASECHGYSRLTLQQIADTAGVSKPLPLHYFGTMTKLRRCIMREAVRVRNVALVAQGLALKDPHALKAPADLQALARASI